MTPPDPSREAMEIASKYINGIDHAPQETVNLAVEIDALVRREVARAVRGTLDHAFNSNDGSYRP